MMRNMSTLSMTRTRLAAMTTAMMVMIADWDSGSDTIGLSVLLATFGESCGVVVTDASVVVGASEVVVTSVSVVTGVSEVTVVSSVDSGDIGVMVGNGVSAVLSVVVVVVVVVVVDDVVVISSGNGKMSTSASKRGPDCYIES